MTTNRAVVPGQRQGLKEETKGLNPARGLMAHHMILSDNTRAHRLSAGASRLGTVEELDVRWFAHPFAVQALHASADSKTVTE